MEWEQLPRPLFTFTHRLFFCIKLHFRLSYIPDDAKQQQWTISKKSASEQVSSPNGPVHFRNAARSSPLSGHHVPNKYGSPLDTLSLVNTNKFYSQNIENRPDNLYTRDPTVIELTEDGEVNDPISASTSPNTSVWVRASSSEGDET